MIGHAPQRSGGDVAVLAEEAHTLPAARARSGRAGRKQNDGAATPAASGWRQDGEGASPSCRTKTGRPRGPRASTAVAAGRAPAAATEETPLRIPFGNKDVALRLGARYRAGGWYAPPGTDIAEFRQRGWL